MDDNWENDDASTSTQQKSDMNNNPVKVSLLKKRERENFFF